MKKALFLFAAALLLPLSQAWATGASYYAKLYVYQADGNPTGAGTVYASTSSTSAGTSTEAKTSGNKGKPVSLYAWGVANDGYRLKGWTANKDGSDIIVNSAVSPYEFLLNCSSQDNGTAEYSRYAVFEEKPVRTLTFTKVGNGSYSATANGSKVDNPTELSTRFTVTFDATPDSGWKFVRWYQVGGDTLSEEKSFTRAFDADTAIGVEFKEKGSPYEVGGVRYKTIAEAVAALPGGVGEITLADDDEMESSTLPANVTLTIPKGSKLSIASGVTFTVNGTVAILGALANSGTVSGSGKVVLYKHVFTQTGVGDQPITTDSFAGSNVKYYKTTLASGGTLTGTNPSCTYNHGARVMRNGALAAACDWSSSVTPAGLYCSINSGVAQNHITGFLSSPACYYTDTATAFAQVKNNTTTKMLLMLKDAAPSASQLNSAGLTTDDGAGRKKLDKNLGILDCASYKITIQPSYIDGAYKHIVLNGTYYVPTLFYGGGSTCINCTVDVTKAKGNYASVINIYDCAPGAFLKGFDGTAENPSVNIYSSGDRVYNTSSFSSTSCYYIYGGHWATKPGEAFLSKITKDYVVKNCGATCPISGGADCWHIEAPSGDEVAQVGSVYYSSLKDALDAAAAKNNTTVTLLQACTLDQPWTLASGKTLRIELAGRQVTAPNGFIVNKGTLEIGDKNSSLSGNAVTAASGYLFDNYGTLRVAYGVYSGAVNLRKNSQFIMHHGHHTGVFSVESGAVATSVSDIRGGRFSQNMADYLNDGYVCRGLGDGRYAVTLKPFAVVTPHSTSGYETGFKFVAMTDADKALYLNSSKVRSSYPVDEDWFRRAELVSYVDVYTGHYVDCLVKFDRRTEKGTVKVRANSVSTTLGTTLEANVAARQLSPNLGDKQKRYSFFIDDSADGHKYDTLTLDIGNNNNLDNIGTTCTVWMDLWTGSLGDVWESIPLDGGSYKFAGKGAIAGSKDYTSLQEALTAAGYAGTVRLSKDCSETIVVSATKTFIVDKNNFNFTGSVSGGTGYSATPTDLGDGKTQYAVTPIPYAITYELNGGVNHADNPSTYTIESAAITLKDPTREHYVFTGWTPAGTIAAGSTGDKSFAANWKLERVNVTVPDVAHMTKVVTVASGKLEQVDAITYTVDYGAQVTVVYTAATGYEPASKECTIASATAGALVPDVPTSKATSYPITYVLNGGVNHPDNPATYTIEDSVTLKNPTRAGYCFMGWAEGGTIPSGSTGAKTFTATWKKSTGFYLN